MALSKIDVANMLTGATPVANGGTGISSGTSGQFLKFTGSTTLASATDNAGITEADQWRLTTEFTGDATPIASNWERADTDGFGKIGTGMTESSGVFSFASTGVYLLTYQFIHQFDASDGYTLFDLETTTDNSTYSRISRHHMGGSGGDHRSGFCNAIFDVTNVSTHKVRVSVSNTNSSNSTKGSSSEQQTGVTFIRLGDT